MRSVRRVLVVLAVMATVIGGIATIASAGTPPDITIVGGPAAVSDGLASHLELCAPGSVSRVGDIDRFATAARLSERFTTADTVFVATGTNFPDAMAAGAIAAQIGAPILLATRDSIPQPTRTALNRFAPSTIVLLGGTAAISDAVETRLAADFGTVVRIAGVDRYATAAGVSHWFFSEPTSVDTVYLALGTRFVDTIVAGPAATRDGAPVLLTTRDRVPAVTMTEIERLAPTNIVIVGSTSAVTLAVEGALTDAGYVVTRLAGPSRWATSAAAADAAPAGAKMFIVTGDNFPDGLATIPVAQGAPILLVRHTELHQVTADAVARRIGSPCDGWTPPFPQVGSGKRVIYSLSEHQIWMIDGNEQLVDTYPVTGRRGIPHTGTYRVFSKSIKAYAPYGGITMRHMVRFVRPGTWGNQWSYGFHSIPRYSNGQPMQTEAELGSYGSGGCVRQADYKAEAMYAWAGIGTTVIVIP